MSSLRILHIAAENFAGVPYDFMKMHRLCGDESKLITLHANPLGFTEDICMNFYVPRSDFARKWRSKKALVQKEIQGVPLWKPASLTEKLWFGMRDLLRKPSISKAIRKYELDSYPIIHFDGGLDFTRKPVYAERWKKMGHSIVSCYYGSDLRSRGIIPRMNEITDLHITSEFDHLDMMDELYYVFYPYDTSELPEYTPPAPDARPRIVHSPTNRLYKGTDLIVQVIEKLRKSFDFEFLLLEGMQRHQVLSIKKTCTISIDQVGGRFGGTGYGKAGLETLAMGIPTITNMTREYAKWLPNNPFVIANSAAELEDSLIFLLKNPESAQETGLRGKEWVQKYHSPINVNKRLYELYTLKGII
jgi:glycosyltransferase involved in cell wall biosynthesis